MERFDNAGMNESQIMVSVVCITYNQEKYIRQTLESLVNQKTSFKYEIIVHDDASSDSTVEIISEFVQRYPQLIIPILEEENQYSKKQNMYLECIRDMCRGKYIAWCEGDDYWSSDLKLQKQVSFLENNDDYIACIHETETINCITGEKTYINGSKINYDVCIEEIFKNDKLPFQLSSLIYRSNIEDKLVNEHPAFYFKTKGYFDLVLGLYLLSEGKMYYYNEVMSVYRRFANGSWTSLNTDPKKMSLHLANVCEMYSEFNVYTERKYDDYINCLIEKKQKKIEKLADDKTTAIKLQLKMKYVKLYRVWCRVIGKFKK